MKRIEKAMITALKEHLIEGNPITALEAAVLFGIPSLGPIITRIKRAGYKIETKRIPYALALRRINEVAVLRPPANLPFKELKLTEYIWTGL